MKPFRVRGETVSKRVVVVLLVVLVTVGVVAGIGLSKTTTRQAQSRSSTSPPPHLSRTQAALLWDRCMRRHGVPEADPGQANPQNMPSTDSPIFRAASAACHAYRLAAEGGAQQSAQREAAFRAGWLRWARCIRTQHVPIPDPTFNSQGQVDITLPPGYRYHPPDPRFLNADRVCHRFNPKENAQP
jgi:hypothetical protein